MALGLISGITAIFQRIILRKSAVFAQSGMKVLLSVMSSDDLTHPMHAIIQNRKKSLRNAKQSFILSHHNCQLLYDLERYVPPGLKSLSIVVLANSTAST